MKFIRTNPVFSALLVVFAIIVGVELWWMYSGGREEDALERQLETRLNEIESLQRRNPAPTDDNLRRAQDDLDRNREVLSTMLRSLNVVGPDELEYFKGQPDNSINAYFDIAQFIDSMREAARASGIELNPDEHFGFSAYANVGPEEDLIQTVYRQRRIVEYLLRALYSSRPRMLIAVQRERPARTVPPDANGKKATTSPAPPSSPENSATARAPTDDIFTIDPQVSARVPGYVQTLAFRIIFAGQTAALRGFMNALAAPEIPLVVRSVEVVPNNAADSKPTDNRPGAGRPTALFGRPGAGDASADSTNGGAANVPIVKENDSRFTVTVELFEVKIPES